MTTATQHYSNDQLQYSQNIVEAVNIATEDVDMENIDAWWTIGYLRMLAIVRSASPHLYQAARNYLQVLAAQNRVELTIPAFSQPNLPRLTISLRVTGPVAFKTSMAAGKTPEQALKDMKVTLSGSTVRKSLDVGRDLIQDVSVANKQIVGWRRVTDADPCYFCALLASRGAVYESRDAALFSHGDKYHDHCQCHAEPLFREEEEPQSVQELYDFYQEATRGTSGREAIKAFRKAWNSRGKNG